jgi:hypothetical protein
MPLFKAIQFEVDDDVYGDGEVFMHFKAKFRIQKMSNVKKIQISEK